MPPPPQVPAKQNNNNDNIRKKEIKEVDKFPGNDFSNDYDGSLRPMTDEDSQSFPLRQPPPSFEPRTTSSTEEVKDMESLKDLFMGKLKTC